MTNQERSCSVELQKRVERYESVGISSIAKGAKPLFLQKGNGLIVEDIAGKKYIDCTSGFGVMAVGHGNSEIARAISKQAASIAHAMFGIQPTEIYANLLEKIATRIGRSSSPQVLLSTSGSAAIEAAIKIALRHSGCEQLIAFQGGYHGQTIGALGVTAHNVFRSPFRKIVANNTTFLPYPREANFRAADPDGENLESTIQRIRDLITNKASGQGPFGAILVEPMQNPSGYIIPPKQFLPELRKICDEFNILLIVDEIFTGFGRTGNWLLADAVDVKADITCVGKCMSGGLPIAAVVAEKSIMASLITDFLVPLQGGTFTGNPVTCAASMSCIEIIERDGLVEQSKSLGETLLSLLQETLIDCPWVSDVRGTGLAIAIEFSQYKDRLPIDHCFATSDDLLSEGVIALITGLPDINAIALAPPLISSESEIKQIHDLVSKSILSLGK